MSTLFSYTFTPDAALEALLHDLHARFVRTTQPADAGAYARLLAALGDPHLRLPPVFHVAGTNGKGSTLAFIRALLESAGLVVHVYTSPHLVRFEERFILAGQPAAPDLLAETFRRVADLSGDDINFPALMTAVAFDLFARTTADVVLLETGVGGEKDPTNVVPAPEAAIITRISYDHVQMLGPTLADIARAKAGIIKAGCPVIIAPQVSPEVMPVFAKRAHELSAPLIDVVPPCIGEDGFFSCVVKGRTYVLPLPALSGLHQVVNAATALTAVAYSRFAGVLDDPACLARAMQTVRWPGRLQKLTRGPLVDLLGPDDELWLDGAHNDSGAEVLAAALAQWRAHDPRPVHLLTAVKSRKDWRAVIAPLLPHVDSLSCLRADFDAMTARMMSAPEDLWAEIKADPHTAQMSAVVSGCGVCTAHEAMSRVRQKTKGGQRFIIAGSLYLAGQVLRDHG